VKKAAASALALGAIVIVSVIIIGLITYAIASANLKNGSNEVARSGQTSAQYAQLLTDTQSSQALLDLINAQPGFDTYVVSYPGPFDDLDTMSYQFSSDAITYSYYLGGELQTMTWRDHGIERLQREASGGTLDDY
jgi:hypothetical protein